MKLRVQSSHFSAIWLILKEVVKRIESTFEMTGKSHVLKYLDTKLEIDAIDAIPLNEMFQAIDDHFSIRTEITRIKKIVGERSIQYRVIQKRLLSRFKVSSST